jgi:hypothetical protein
MSQKINFVGYSMVPKVFTAILQHNYNANYLIRFSSSFPKIFYICGRSDLMEQGFYSRKYNYCYFLGFSFCISMSLYLIALY